MPHLTIVGLGPGSKTQLTLEAWDVLCHAEDVYLRTANHPLVAELELPGRVQSLDHLYQQAADYHEVYEAIVAEALRLARRSQGVVYAVPGHPLVGEATVAELLQRCREENIPVRIVDGLSFVEPVLSALGVDALSPGLHLADALAPTVDPTLPSLFAQVHHQRVAAELKVTLLEWYPPEHPVSLVSWAGVPQRQSVQVCPLSEIDHQPLSDHLTCLYLPALGLVTNVASFENFVQIIERLRAPDGCPWDREQTHTTLKPHLLEESYECLDALDTGDTAALAEELGDLLLQIALHAQIADEAGEFSIRDVVRGIATKIVRRHPHVFGDVQIATADEVRHQWEELKRDERGAEQSALASVPAAMPALAASRALQERAARLGFERRQTATVWDELALAADGLRRAADGPSRLPALGELLFLLANMARLLDLDPEEALREANRRFRQRFAALEAACRQRGVDIGRLSPAELDALWDEAARTP